MFRLRHIRLIFLIHAILILLIVFIVIVTQNVNAQGQHQLVPLVTDQTPLGVSNLFGVAVSPVINQAGDYAFIGNGSTTLFLRRSGSQVVTRVIQSSDEVPGYPDSAVDLIRQPRLNNPGLLAFILDFFPVSGSGQGIIFTFDGVSLQKVVDGNDPAPGGGGANFERALNLVGLNDSGDMAFTAPLVPSGSGLPAQTTLYILPDGSGAVRIAGLGDTAPGTGGTFGSLNPISFNDQGETLFSASIVGGSGGTGLFIGSTAGVRKVVANGDANPLGGAFSSVSTGLLNNAGQVAFTAGGALWVDTPGTGISPVVITGDGTPLPVGGTFGSIVPAAFNDAGDIAFNSTVAGSLLTNTGLFRYRPGNPVELVAYRNQSATGVAGQTFNSFSGISINSSGVISFLANLLGGPVLRGIFQQTNTNPPVNIALDGQATNLAGGGSYSLTNLPSTRTLDDNAVYFGSDIAGGIAYSAQFLIKGPSTTFLMSTAEPLPAGARVSFRTFRVSAAGDYIGFTAQKNGGRSSIVVHNIITKVTTVVTTDGDMAPGTGTGVLRLLSRNTVFLSDSGNVAFSTQIIGGPASGSSALFLGTPGSGLTRIVVHGDVFPLTGSTFANVALNSVTPSPINNAGQVVFSALLTGAGNSRNLFVWSSGSGISKVALVGDITNSGGAISSFPANQPWINSSGQVAFLANTEVGTGIYIGTPGGTPEKVVAAGDNGPAGSTFSGFALPGFNDSGEVAFMATLNGGPGGGIFTGSNSGPPVPIALNGDSWPAGGNFSIVTAQPHVSINNLHEVVFRADIVGGSADSGYFVRRGTVGVFEALALQGQPAPGTTGNFDEISPAFNGFLNENFQLASEGDLAFQNFVVENGTRKSGIWHVGSDNSVEEILVRGVVAPEFGGGIAVASTPSTSWNSGRRYPLWARVSGGTITNGIFLYVPVINTNTPTGTNVVVGLTDSTTSTSPVSMTFDMVTQEGDTSLTTSSGGPALPASFALGDPAVFFNISTTAVFTGPAQVCIDFGGISFPQGAILQLLHFENGAWVDVTTSGPNGTVICGSVNSLSPFTVAQIVVPPGLEADVAPRPNGGGTVVVSDWVQVGRFSVGLDIPAIGSEFQRADCAPRSTLGDGQITVADWVQAGRYSVGLDPVTGSGGPAQSGGAFTLLSMSRSAPFKEVSRSLRVINQRLTTRQKSVIVPVKLTALGGENAVSFTLQFDPVALSFEGFEAGRDTQVLVQTGQLEQGRVGIALALQPGMRLAAGTREVIRLRFKVLKSDAGRMDVNFVDGLVPLSLISTEAEALPVQTVGSRQGREDSNWPSRQKQ